MRRALALFISLYSGSDQSVLLVARKLLAEDLPSLSDLSLLQDAVLREFVGHLGDDWEPDSTGKQLDVLIGSIEALKSGLAKS